MNTKVQENFSNQRVIRLSANAIARCKELHYVKDCYLTEICYFMAEKNYCNDCLSQATEFLIIYCIGGSGWCQLGAQVWNIREGNMVIIPAGVAHRYGANEEFPWTVYSVRIIGNAVPELIANLGVTEFQPLVDVKEIVRITDCFESLFHDLQASYISGVYTDEILFLLSAAQTHIIAILLASKQFSENRDNQIEQRIFRSISYMKNNIGQALTLEHLAEQINMSSSHYSACFKQQINNSPIAFFNNLKMQRACELFSYEDNSIALVANRLGFEDSFYFSRIFKKIVGSTPSQYIKRAR